MATISECREAVDRLAAFLEQNAAARGKVDLDRSLSVDIPDLSSGFHGRLHGGRLTNITDGSDPDAKIKLTARSDDLIDLVDGKINFPQAWATGKVSVKASVFDLMKLRSLF
jgi:putative sterol carrier protein